MSLIIVVTVAWSLFATLSRGAVPVLYQGAQDFAITGIADPAVVLAAGDVAQCPATREIYQLARYIPWELPSAATYFREPQGAVQTAKLIQGQPGIVLALGDLAYKLGAINEYRYCYDRAWGSFKHRTFPTPGNHEYNGGVSGYFKYWGPRAGHGRNGYYSFDYNGWHIVSLNSETDARPGSAQARWLEADLRNTSADCILAFFHRPAFSSRHRSGAGNARALFKLLYEHRATLVLSGHNHFYERLAPMNPGGQLEPRRGLRQFVAGTGGAVNKPVVTRVSYSEALVSSQFGVLRLELRQARYSWSFLAVNGGEVLDRGAGACVQRSTERTTRR